MVRKEKPRVDRASPVEQRAPEVVRRLKRAYPDARVALRFTNPLECLVATILSAQCTDERVNQVTAGLFRKYRTPQDYLRVPESELDDRATCKRSAYAGYGIPKEAMDAVMRGVVDGL